MKKIWVSWSTGKDSAYALHVLRRDERYEILGLFTTVTEEYNRVAMHSTREELLKLQAARLDLPLQIVALPKTCTNEIYEERMAVFLGGIKAAGAEAVSFGDLFLTDIRAYRERQLAPFQLEPVFPLWGRATQTLAKQIIGGGIKAVLVCVDPRQISGSFVGRLYDQALLDELPPRADPCGENGEFHTFVFESPDFSRPIAIEVGERVSREGFDFADVRVSPAK